MDSFEKKFGPGVYNDVETVVWSNHDDIVPPRTVAREARESGSAPDYLRGYSGSVIYTSLPLNRRSRIIGV